MENLFELLETGANRFGLKTACQIREENHWRTLSYAQLRDTAEALARSLKSYGFRSGDIVALLSENRPEWAIAFFALQRLGIVTVPLDRMLKINELQAVLEQSNAKLVIASKPYIGLLTDMPIRIPLFSLDEEKERIPTLPAEIERGLNAPEIGKIEILPDSVAVMIFTSGTTGKPKGVMLTHQNFFSNLEAIFKIFPPRFFQSNFLSLLPLNHAYELTCGFLAPLMGGGTITYQNQLKPSHVLETMQETKTQIMVTVPAILEMLARAIAGEAEKNRSVRKKYLAAFRLAAILPLPARRWLFRQIHAVFGGHFRYFASGGAPLPAPTQELFERLGIQVIQGYGLTETSPILTVNPFCRTKKSSVGRAIPGVEILIAEDGEILARGPNLMKGYYKEPSATEETMRNGYFSTGDLGSLDSDGYLYITGRKKNLIVSATGKKIFPEEIEEKFKGNPLIQEICVLGRQEGNEEEVTAIVRPNQERFANYGFSGHEKEVRERIWQEVREVNRTLADYKRVKEIFLWEKEFPKTTTMKIKRLELKNDVEQFLQEKAAPETDQNEIKRE